MRNSFRECVVGFNLKWKSLQIRDGYFENSIWNEMETIKCCSAAKRNGILDFQSNSQRNWKKIEVSFPTKTQKSFLSSINILFVFFEGHKIEENSTRIPLFRLLHKCRSEKKIIYLFLLVTTDPIYAILLPYCNTLYKQTIENPKETCNLNIHFHTLSFHLLMAQGLFFVHVGLYKKTIVITVQCQRAHELDNNNGRENNKICRKIGAII